MFIKLVIEVLANTLKSLMPKLTGEQQANFVPGRQPIDNIVIAQQNDSFVGKKNREKR